MLAATEAQARHLGIDSSQFKPTLTDGCNNCHRTQPPTALEPAVALMASASTLTAGQQITLTFVVTSQNPAVQTAAGFNIRSSQRGTFAAVVGDTTTQPIANLDTTWLEATHTNLKDNDGMNKATFTVLWTPLAGASGTVTFTAWGNSVNKSGNNVGDRAAMTTLDVTVCTTLFYPDADLDGFGSPNNPVAACTAPGGYVTNNTDCDDTRQPIHPGGTELCNGMDDNCNNVIDEGVKTTYYLDGDADGYGGTTSTTACSPPTQYVAIGGDCNDGSAAVRPGANETCNGIDDNCNNAIDEGVMITYYLDGDGDHYGGATTTTACSPPNGYAAIGGDCNDQLAAVNPAATEACNGIDDNCNTAVDEGLATSNFYYDSDGDGYGSGAPKPACNAAQAGAKYVATNTDCDDTNVNIFPGAPEICANQKDDNCNGVVDTDAPATSTFYRDADGDGFGSAASGTVMACAPPAGYVSSNTDCNDSAAGGAVIHPGATEICNGKDDNCDNSTDEGLGSLSCGDGPCRTTVTACVGGIAQVCTPVCPEAGVDAAKDGDVPRDTGGDSTKDASAAPDVAQDNGQTDSAPGASNDVVSVVPTDAASDSSAPPPGPQTDGGVSADARPSDAKSDTRVADSHPPDAGANEDNGEPTDSGCSCRLAQPSGRRDVAILGLVLLSLVVIRRRAPRDDP